MTIDLPALQHFLLWCALFNFAFVGLMFLVFVLARDTLFRLHSRWFNLSRERFDAIWYLWLGGYKLAVWFVLLIPALALRAL